MTQGKLYSFGIDYVSFIGPDFEVFVVDDPQNGQLNLTYENAIHRGGTNNDTRATAVHSRNGELTIGTGIIDFKLAQMLTGGTITSLGTSAASITTGSVTGVNTLFGTTATLPTAISTVTINSPTLVKTNDYYMTADAEDTVTVTRVTDGKVFPAITLTNSATGFDLDTERGIQFSTTDSATSLTPGEKAYSSARQTISSINQSISFDETKPEKMSVKMTYTFNGLTREINVPVVQASGTVQGNSATEFQVQDLTMQVEVSDELNALATMSLQG